MAHPILEPKRELDDISLKSAIQQVEGTYGISIEQLSDMVNHQDWRYFEAILAYRLELFKQALLTANEGTVVRIQGSAMETQFLLDLPDKLEGIKTLKTNHQPQEQP